MVYQVDEKIIKQQIFGKKFGGYLIYDYLCRHKQKK
jgi:hypothetical protein